MENNGEVIVNIHNLVKRYGDLTAVDHLSLSIREGEVYGLLGPNGSGKTTALHCLLSLLAYESGEISIFGRKMTPRSFDIKQEIGVVMQNVIVFDSLTVSENIDFFCSMYVRDKKRRRELVQEAIAFAGLEDFQSFRPRKLSGGLLRRLNIACGIAHKPRLIIFDEPTVAVDPQSRNRILEGILELNRNGSTIIYTSHYMEEVEQICSRIAILDRGRKIAEGTSHELKESVRITETIEIELPTIREGILPEIRGMEHIISAEYRNQMLTLCFGGGSHNLISILDLLRRENLMVGQVYAKRPTLNDVFLEVTGKELRDHVE